MRNPFREYREMKERLAQAESDVAALREELCRIKGITTDVAALREELCRIKGITTDDALNQRMHVLVGLLDGNSRPNNTSALWSVARDLPAAFFNLKFYGYDLAERLRLALPARTDLRPVKANLRSKPTTQADLESDWAAYWAQEYKIPRVFHRKLWELFYCSQALYERGCLRPGARAISFGCGAEPLPSYFASKGVKVLATDAPSGSRASEMWSRTNEHADSLEKLLRPNLVDRETFFANVEHRGVDMNDIPTDLRGFDFAWSICAFEHLGTIAKGLDFVENCMETLKPGGVAVHTTEFAFADDKNTLDNFDIVFYKKRHLSEIAERLKAKGHHVAPLDFDVGRKPMDRFIDLPPYSDWAEVAWQSWAGGQAHLKLEWDGFIVTCFGLIVTKAL